MFPKVTVRWHRYAAASVAVGIAFWLTVQSWEWVEYNPFIFFFAAVTFSAWYGGIGPGFVATSLSMLLVLFFMFPPFYSFWLASVSDLVRLLIFLMVAGSISTLIGILRRSERENDIQRRRWYATLASIGDGVIATDAQGKTTFMNATAEQLTGWQLAGAQGHALSQVFNFVDGETRQPVPDPAYALLQKQVKIEYPYNTILLTRDGREHLVDATVTLLQDEPRHPEGVVLVFRDVSKQRRAEEESQRFAVRLQVLAAVSKMLSEAVPDLSQVFQTVTQQLANLIGDGCGLRLLSYDGQRLDPVAFFHPNPEALARLQELMATSSNRLENDAQAQVVRLGQPLLIAANSPEQLRAQVKPEYWPYLERFGIQSLLIVPLRARGRIIGTLFLWRSDPNHPYTVDDQTFLQELADRAALAIDNSRLYLDSQRQREQLHVTLTSIGDGVITTDPEGNVTFMNAVAEQLTGWPQAEAIGRPLVEIFTIVNAHTRQPVVNPVLRVLQEERVVGLANHTILIARDGTERAIEDSGAPIRDDQGILFGVVLVFHDVTRRYQAEESLRQSKAQVDTILHNVLDGITLQAPTGELLYANDVAAHILGYPSAQTLQTTPVSEIMQRFMLLDEDGGPFPLERMPGRLALRGIRGPDVTLRFKLVDTGEERWSLVRAVPVFESQGKVLFAINFFHDITASKRAEAALQAQREWLQVTLASIGDAVVATDLDGRAVFINPRAELLTGWPQAEAWGQPWEEVFTVVERNSGRRVNIAPDLVLLAESVVRLGSDLVLRTRDGREVPISASLSAIRGQRGDLIGMVLVFRDVTAERQAEEQQAFLANASKILAASLDFEQALQQVAQLTISIMADWCVVYIVNAEEKPHAVAFAAAGENQGTSQTQQYERYAQVGQPLGHLVIQLRQAVCVPDISKRGVNHHQLNEEQTRHLQVLQQVGATSVICVPLSNREECLGAMLLVSAETRRAYGDSDLALAQELARRSAVALDNARLYREARHAVRVRDEFLSLASHELKTPITALQGYAELLQRRMARESQGGTARDQRAVQTIYEQAIRLTKLIELMLDLSRIQMGQLTIERLELDIALIIQRLVSNTSLALQGHQILLELPNEPLFVAGDEVRLEQVFQNLLNNAIKYSPQGGRILVQVTQDGAQVCVAISDQGIGIPAEALSRLFSRFYRAENVAGHQIAGLGLGLYVVKEIITRHDGMVDVTSREGEGSTFTVCLPLIRTVTSNNYPPQ